LPDKDFEDAVVLVQPKLDYPGSGHWLRATVSWASWMFRPKHPQHVG
jgi:hypothetical protein